MAKAKNNFTDSFAPEIRCLALDIGGVFHADVWETVFEKGLAEHYGLDMPDVLREGGKIWDQHAYTASTAEAFWQNWEEALGHSIDRDIIDRLIEAHVWVDRTVLPLAERCLEQGIDVCFISNSTSFWFERQMEKSGLSPYIEQIAPYLSHEIGYPKTHPEGGLARLARDHDPKTTLFVDDRKSNTDRAAELGMQTLLYMRQPGVSLEQALSERLFGNRSADYVQKQKADMRFDRTPV